MSDGFEEMGLPPLGHNQPPREIDAAALFAEVDRLTAHANKWIAEVPVIQDSEKAAGGQVFIDQLRGLRDDLGLALKRERRPHDDAIAAIKDRYLDPQDKVRLSLEELQQRMRYWLKREEERLAAERIARERAADEARFKAEELDQLANTAGATIETQLAAERAAAAARDAEHDAQRAARARPRVRSDYSKKAMVLHSNWKGRVVDYDKAIAYYRRHAAFIEGSKKLMEQAATRVAKAVSGDQNQAPPGIEFYNEERAQ